MTKSVVLILLLRLRQDPVGFVDLFEFRFGILVPRIAVRMILHGFFAKGFFYFLIVGAFVQPQNFIVVTLFLRHWLSSLPSCGFAAESLGVVGSLLLQAPIHDPHRSISVFIYTILSY